MATPVNMPSGSAVPSLQPAASPTDFDINALAGQIKSMVDAASVGSVQLSQGVVVATALTATPPTASVTLSGSTTQIDGVSFMETYTPVVNDVVNVLQQGNALVIIGQVASGASTGGTWTAPTLSTGFTTNGDSQGNLEYRRVLDHGDWKMQWRGAVARTANTTVIAAASLVAPFRPAIKRKVIAARGFGGGDTSIQIVFNTDGSVVLDGATYAGATTGAEVEMHNHPVWNGLDGSATGHYAGNDYVPSTGADSHVHTGNAVTAPDWVSFNGLEYFL